MTIHIHRHVALSLKRSDDDDIQFWQTPLTVRCPECDEIVSFVITTGYGPSGRAAGALYLGLTDDERTRIDASSGDVSSDALTAAGISLPLRAEAARDLRRYAGVVPVRTDAAH